MAFRRGHIVMNGEKVGSSCGYDGLHVILIPVHCKKKGIFWVMAKRAGERSLVKLPPLGGLGFGKCILCVEDGIAKKKISCSVELWCAALCGDLQARASRPRESRGVGVLVHLHFLHARRGNS